MNLRHLFIGLALSVFLSSSFANPYQYYPGPQQQIQQSPADILQQGIEQLTDYLASRDDQNSPPIEVFLENTIAPFFDFTYMAKWAAGPQYNYMTPQQGAEMEQKLRRLFFAAMIDKLAEYRHARVKFLPPVGNPQTGEMTLRLMAFQEGSPYPQRLSFKMYRGNNGWKVYDVSSNGQSAVAFYRTQFALEARQQNNQNYGGNNRPGQHGMQYNYRR